MDITIREATHDDAATIARYNQLMAMETEKRLLHPATVERGVSMLLSSPEKGLYLIAESSGVPAGQCMVTYEWSDWRCGDFWWIQSVYVLPEYRRNGIFSTMYRNILERAASTDLVAGIRLYVEKQNTIAQQTYLNLGMDHAHYAMLERDFTKDPMK